MLFTTHNFQIDCSLIVSSLTITFQDLVKHLDDESQRIDDMTLLGEVLQEKLSKSGSLNVSVKLTNIGKLYAYKKRVYLKSKNNVLVETQHKDAIKMKQRRFSLKVYCNLVDYSPCFEYSTVFSITRLKLSMAHLD